LTREQHLWVEHRGAYLLEDERVEFIGANVALRAASMLAFGDQRVVAMAVVIAMNGSVTAAHCVTRHADAAVAAFEDVSQKPVTWLCTPRTPFGIIATDSLRRLEDLFAHNGRDRDRNPLITRTQYPTLTFFCSPIHNVFSAIEIRAAHVCLVTQ